MPCYENVFVARQDLTAQQVEAMGDALAQVIETAGGKVNWSTYTDTQVTGEFSHPQGGSVSVTWV